MIKSVISDLGKVIIFFDNHIFFRKIEKYSAYSLPEISEKVERNIDIIFSFDRGEITPVEFYREVKKVIKAKIDFDQFYTIYNDVFWLNKPVLEILKKLKPKYKLILLSNTDQMRFSFITKKFPQILFFDAYILSFEVGAMKPENKIYKKALEEAEAPPEDCLFIDDIEENIIGARRMGLDCIHFQPETDLRAEFKKRGINLDQRK
ncbi:MAG: HAD-IA family hydrolase [Candidatus Aminicenantales bacterium]